MTNLKPSTGISKPIVSEVVTPDRAVATSISSPDGKWQVKRTAIISSSKRVVTVGKED